MAIPLLGRLSVLEYPLILISFTLAWLEYIIAIITHLLPDPIIEACTFTVTKFYSLFNLTIYRDKKRYYFYNEEGVASTYQLMEDLINSENITQMVRLFGYDIEDHVVQTKDNYLLNIQRLVKPNVPRNGKVVYLHHGLLMSSEIWVTMLNPKLNLPFVLYELGYDVWLGNNRGNKYCLKHLFKSSKTEQFWNFSIDEFALFDIPNIIDYILDITETPKLTYIGFSQGTAQVFAAVSVNNSLNKKLDRIIAISPATTPHGLYSKFLDIFIKASPNIIYLLFSRKVLMPSVSFWQKIMYPPLFNTTIDYSNFFLFNWKSKNISNLQKLASYSHLYSTTSVKTVVHWFQIMKNKNFQMYFDSSLYAPISYPLKNIKVPIYLIYGNCDSLVDIDVMKKQLPTNLTTAVEVDKHEHLDNLWGSDVEEAVFRHVLRFLNSDIRNNGSIAK